jgi:predicted regulator of Ras-like GTPase activity (Roadblock/LC7/MglB family)
MAETGFGDYFIRDVDDEALEEGGPVQSPVVVPQPAPAQAPAPVTQARQPVAPPSQPAPQATAPPAASPVAQPVVQPVVQPAPAVAPAVAQPAPAAQNQREEQLARALNTFMASSSDVQASALVSLDGFIIASALPRGMQEDRVGAMSAAILGLGERAAQELGRGGLTQVFIEGADGYVLLLSAGDRAVLTVLADKDAKLGLVLYDMKATAARIGEVLR